MEATTAAIPEEQKRPPPKTRFAIPTFCVNITSAIVSKVRVKVLSILPSAEDFQKVFFRCLPARDFVNLHCLVLVGVSFVGSALLWFCQRHKKVKGFAHFIDYLFFAISAITNTGLATLNVSSLNTFQQIVLCIFFILGSVPATGVVALTLRVRAFEKAHCKEILAKRAAREARIKSRQNAADTESSIALPDVPVLQPPSMPLQRTWRSFLSQHTVGRNSAFQGLTRTERQIISCTEYDAVKLLRKIVILYAIFLPFIGAVILAFFFQYYQAGVVGRDGVQPWALGIFNAISAFNNAGMSLMNDSMIPFRLTTVPVTVMCVLMLAGNTAFPIFLRCFLWIILRCLPRNAKCEQTRSTLTYILAYPRRVYTHLFPVKETWYLVGALCFLNGVDFILFERLTIHHPDLEGLSAGRRMLIGLFQSLSVRCTGFNIVTMSSLSVALLSAYVSMMYISAFPVTILMRSSNVYEERSLGIYSSSSNSDTVNNESKWLSSGHRGRIYFLRQQLKTQLNYDIWILVAALQTIIIIEGGVKPLADFAIFYVIFEVFSAYANVGLSLGVSDDHFSFCGSFHTGSKIILMGLMVRGRHRPMPHSIDAAVQFTDNDLGALEEADELERDHERERERDEHKVD